MVFRRSQNAQPLHSSADIREFNKLNLTLSQEKPMNPAHANLKPPHGRRDLSGVEAPNRATNVIICAHRVREM